MCVWTINEPKIGITANRFAQVGRLTTNVFYSWRYFRYGLNVTPLGRMAAGLAQNNRSGMLTTSRTSS